MFLAPSMDIVTESMADCAACRSLASASSTGGDGPGSRVAVGGRCQRVSHGIMASHTANTRNTRHNTWSHVSHWLRNAWWPYMTVTRQSRAKLGRVTVGEASILPATDLRCRRLESETCPVRQCILLLQISLGVLRQCPSSYHRLW